MIQNTQANPKLLRILVVEDNPINQLYITESLKLLGYNSQLVETGGRGVEAVLRDDFDIILMDCRTPDIDGIEATKIIRQLELDGLLMGRRRIVAVTANATIHDREICMDAGMDDFVSKPFTHRQLAAVLRDAESEDVCRDRAPAKQE